GRPENEVHRNGPVVRNVRAVNDLADAEFRDETPQAFFSEAHRIDEDLLLEVFAGMFLVEAEGAVADDIVGTAGMNENQNSEGLNLGPERIEFGRRRHLTPGVTGNPDTAE